LAKYQQRYQHSSRTLNRRSRRSWRPIWSLEISALIMNWWPQLPAGARSGASSASCLVLSRWLRCKLSRKGPNQRQVACRSNGRFDDRSHPDSRQDVIRSRTEKFLRQLRGNIAGLGGASEVRARYCPLIHEPTDVDTPERVSQPFPKGPRNQRAADERDGVSPSHLRMTTELERPTGHLPSR
jgi:hypothetical protein